LRALAFAADLQRQAHDRVIDPAAHRFVEAVAHPHQDTSSDRVNHALCGVQTGNQKEQRHQCRHASARQNAIINFEHEQRAGEHQKVAHAAEDGGGDKGSPARAECGC